MKGDETAPDTIDCLDHLENLKPVGFCWAISCRRRVKDELGWLLALRYKHHVP